MAFAALGGVSSTAVSYLEANLTAHRVRWGFAPVVPQAESSVRVDQGGTWPSITLRTPDGRWMRVHSARQPIDEAAQWVTQCQIDTTPAPLVCIVGSGAGYVLDVLTALGRTATKYLVLEPEPELLRVCLGRQDWSALIDAGRLMVLAGPTYDGRPEAWRLVDPDAEPPPVMVHTVIGQARPEATQEAARVIGQAVAGARANEEARRRFAGRYLLNTLRNVPVVWRARDVRHLFQTQVAVPAIVAGAGPSLNRNLAELAAIEGWRDRAVVIAVDTALKPMLAADLAPHYVVSVDPSEANARMLTDLPPVPLTSLVAEPSLDPRCFRSFEDRTYVFKVSDTHQPWPWFSGHGIDVGRLRAWGSVLTTAYDFALQLGCNPVVFIGSDLAYTDGQPYCRHTVYEENWAEAAARGATLREVWESLLSKTQLVTVTDLAGGETRSSTVLVAFRDWLAAQGSQETARHIVNATGRGILTGHGITHDSLARTLDNARAAGARGIARIEVSTLIDPKGVLVREARNLIDAILRPVAPIPEWIRFSGNGITLPDTLTALAAACRGDGETGDGDDDGQIDALLRSRAHAALAESEAWMARGASPRADDGQMRLLDVSASAPPPQWRPGTPGDWCLGTTPSTTLPSGPVRDFHSFRYLHQTARRLEHLASLGLPLRERHVLEAAAGVGDLTQFFLDRGCRVHATDGRPLHVSVLEQRYAMHPLVSVAKLALDPPPDDPPGLFDVVLCYGVLNHVSDPMRTLEFLARACGDVCLVEAIVGQGDADAMNPTVEDAAVARAACSGMGCRPSRDWIYARLRRLFPHVYVPTTQPNHYEYPLDWTITSPHARRVVFVAARRALDNPQLLSELPSHQVRH